MNNNMGHAATGCASIVGRTVLALAFFLPAAAFADTTVRINAGGPAFVDNAGNAWQADTSYVVGSSSITNWGPVNTAGASDPTIYQTERYAANLHYAVSVASGNYHVVLRMAEIWAGNVGQRVFNVQIEGVTMATNVDIFKAVGANTAYSLAFDTVVADGQLNIDLVGLVNNGLVNGIEITPLGSGATDTSPPTVPTGLTGAALNGSTVALNWNASTDAGSGVSGYNIYRNGSPIGTVISTQFSDTSAQPNTTYSYAVSATDNATVPNESATSAAIQVTTPANPGGVFYRINAGGSAVVDAQGNPWSADFGFNAGVAANWDPSGTGLVIGGSRVYSSERYSPPGGTEMQYDLPVPNGTYTVNLYFTEHFLVSPGQRIFSVQAEGNTVLSDVDIIAAVGQLAPLVKSFTVNVTDGSLTLRFIHGVENPLINGIEVLGAAGTHAVGGTLLTALPISGLVLANGSDTLNVSASASSFTMPNAVASGSSYNVTVRTQPLGQTCTVTNGSGTMGTADVTNIFVICTANRYALSGTVTGLTSGSLVLANGGATVTIAAPGSSFSFGSVLTSGSGYSVTVQSVPSGLFCAVANGSGNASAANVTNVAVTCVPSTTAYPLAGSISGLTGSGLVLNGNGALLQVAAGATGFSFGSMLSAGSRYSVSVQVQPSGQNCSVANGSGSITTAGVSNVLVTCTTSGYYPLSGSISSLTGSGLVLNGNGALLTIPAGASSFSFGSILSAGSRYSVSVAAQPSGQSCSVINGSGTIGNSGATTVLVTCTSTSFLLSGSVSGLTAGGLVLNGNGALLQVTAGATVFSFGPMLSAGSRYSVSVQVQPSGQTCSVANGSGTIGAANVTNVFVTCTSTSFPLSGAIGGLTGSGLVLNGNGALLTIPAGASSFSFGSILSAGSRYSVSVQVQPNGQSCTVVNGSGAIATGGVTNVLVTCTSTSLLLAGTVSGLTGSGLVLNGNGALLQLNAGATSFSFGQLLSVGSRYSVSVQVQPAGQSCSVSNGSGTITTSGITSIIVSCTATVFPLSGAIASLTGSGLVLNGNGALLTIPAGASSFSFGPILSVGSSYSVSVQKQPAGQNCSVTNGSGTISTTGVTNVLVTCITPNNLQLSGSISGLTGSGLVLNGNGALLTVAAYASSFTFGSILSTGSSYSVSVQTQPSGQSCMVVNGSGTASTSSVSNVTISCAALAPLSQSYSVNASGYPLGNPLWSAKSITFVATSAVTRVQFQSQNGANGTVYGPEVAAVALTPANSTTNLILNGNFQANGTSCQAGTRTLANWVVSTGNIDVLPPTACAYPNTSVAGSYSVDLTGSGGAGAGTIYQDVATQVGTQYTLTFYFGGNGDWQYQGYANDSVIKSMVVSVLAPPQSGTWVATGSMATARSNYTATLLPNGTVLVTGGLDSSNRNLTSAEIYDPATGAWTATGSMTTGRYFHTATLLPNGTVLVAGGYNYPNSWLASAEIYNPATGAWTATGSMIAAHSSHTATLLPNGTVLVAAGNGSAGVVLASAEIYSPTTGTWTATGSMATARSGHTATLLPNGTVLVAGGGTTSAEIYNPAAGSWTATAATQMFSGAVSTLLPNGTVLVAGGCWGGLYAIADAKIYDPSTDTWTATGSMGAAHCGAVATLLPNGTVLVAGGSSFTPLGGGGPSVEIYSPATGAWTATGGMGASGSAGPMILMPNGTVLATGAAKIYYPPPQYSVGDRGPAGGIVVQVSNGGLHGLEISPVDLPLAPFATTNYCTTTLIAPATAVGTGAANTAAIIAACGTNTAAYAARSYVLNGYSDWYLPSYDELNLTMANRPVITNLCTNTASPWYWSSSDHQGANWNALALPCIATSQWDVNKVVGLPIRAMRSF